MSHKKERNEVYPSNRVCDEIETFPYWGNLKKPGISTRVFPQMETTEPELKKRQLANTSFRNSTLEKVNDIVGVLSRHAASALLPQMPSTQARKTTVIWKQSANDDGAFFFLSLLSQQLMV